MIGEIYAGEGRGGTQNSRSVAQPFAANGQNKTKTKKQYTILNYRFNSIDCIILDWKEFYLHFRFWLPIRNYFRVEFGYFRLWYSDRILRSILFG